MFEKTPGFCKAISIFGDGWVLYIVSELYECDRRFSELSQRIPNISPAVLSNRLKRLEQEGVIERLEEKDKLPVIYSLTKRGRGMRPIFEEMFRFSKDL